jgi:hypothetical protein
MMKIKSNKELIFINDIMNEAKIYGLEIEIVWSTLKILKENSNLSIIDALWMGRNEWVK